MATPKRLYIYEAPFLLRVRLCVYTVTCILVCELKCDLNFQMKSFLSIPWIQHEVMAQNQEFSKALSIYSGLNNLWTLKSYIFCMLCRHMHAYLIVSPWHNHGVNCWSLTSLDWRVHSARVHIKQPLNPCQCHHCLGWQGSWHPLTGTMCDED